MPRFTELAAILLSLFLCALPVQAHAGLQDEIDRLTERIDRGHRNAPVFLERGDYYRQTGDWMAALADFRRAEQEDASCRGVELAFARVFCDLTSWRTARPYVEAHLERFPDDLAARVVHAEVLAGLGEHDLSAKAYAEVIARSTRPSPDHYASLARVLERGGRVADAIDCLDAGVTALGDLPSLLLHAVELERSRGSLHAAIERTNSMLSLGGRQERWLTLRGEIELEAGRRDAARTSFAAARRAVALLNSSRRNSRAVLELAARLDALEVRTGPPEIRPSPASNDDQ